VPHALLAAEHNAIVAARRSADEKVSEMKDATGRDGCRTSEPHLLFYAQHQEGTYFCSRCVLDDMRPVEGVTTFRLMEEKAQP